MSGAAAAYSLKVRAFPEQSNLAAGSETRYFHPNQSRLPPDPLMKRSAPLCRWFAVLTAVLFLGLHFPAPAPAETLKDLKERQERVKSVVARVMPSVVAIVSARPDRPGSGSGVVVGKDGLILTAAHVTEATGEELIIIFPDGRRVKGETLGSNRGTDAGMARITEPGEWPAVELGSSDTTLLGDWVIAMGHPGGFNFDRPPPVRLGRVWRRDLDGALFTSCPLIGGDSGGPLFDLEGRVIGIHSSIHGSVDQNRHVAIDTLRADWDRLLKKGEAWGQMTFAAADDDRPITGAIFDRESQNGVKITEVVEDMPAAKAGLKPGDVLIRIAGKEVNTFHALQRFLAKCKPGEKVEVTVRREGETVNTQLELARRRPLDDELEEFRARGFRFPKVEDKPKDPSRPSLGVRLEDTGGNGAKLGEVREGAPAAKAGLRSGDVLLQVNGQEVKDPAGAAETIAAAKAGEKLVFKVRRGEEELTVEIAPE